ncbi:hypothetical protein [Halovulum sp. GXIMD14793]
MKILFGLLIGLICFISAHTDAVACSVAMPRQAKDVLGAELVVLGRLGNYRVLSGADALQQHKVMLETLPLDIGSSLRQSFEAERPNAARYASFDFEIDEALVGNAAGRISVVWYNSTFALPESLRPGSYLIALTGLTLEDQDQSVRIDPNSVPLPVLQLPCSSPFLFPSYTTEADEIFRIISVAKATN